MGCGRGCRFAARAHQPWRRRQVGEEDGQAGRQVGGEEEGGRQVGRATGRHARRRRHLAQGSLQQGFGFSDIYRRDTHKWGLGELGTAKILRLSSAKITGLGTATAIIQQKNHTIWGRFGADMP
eukprot:351528-Chlamydomonas_euryale.AAC.1